MLIRIGQQEEGLARIDSVIHQLDEKRKFNELDALIIALKRKAEICSEIGLYNEMIPAAQRMLDLLGRAEAAEAQGRHADANGYWRRYAEITELLNDQLLGRNPINK